MIYENYIIPNGIIWDWKKNVTEMNRILKTKKAKHYDFMGDFERTYPGLTAINGMQTHTFNNQSLTVEAWATIVLYNGGEGVRTSSVIQKDGIRRSVQSPWAWVNGTWTFGDNVRNYAYKVSRELRGLNPIVE